MDAIPKRLTSVTPSLVVTPCAEAIDFYIEAFGAKEVGQRMDDDNGVVAHAKIEINGSVIMLGDEWPGGPTQSPTSLGGSTCAIFIYTDNVDAMWDKAVAAGAEIVFPLQDQFYGDRSGRLKDPFGHTWGLGQHMEDLTNEELAKGTADFYEQMGQS